MALFLSGPHNSVLSVSIWALWEGGSVGTAAAGAVAMVSIMGV
jgi:ABC-type Fe3+ transport system permease subunit